MRLLKSGAISEATIHKTVIKWVRLHADISGLVIHIPNEGSRSERYGALLKEFGMRPGVSDLFIAMARHTFHGAWIELKSEKGRLSLAQKEFLEEMAEEGYFTDVCYSFDEAVKIISWYCL